MPCPRMQALASLYKPDHEAFRLVHLSQESRLLSLFPCLALRLTCWRLNTCPSPAILFRNPVTHLNASPAVLVDITEQSESKEITVPELPWTCLISINDGIGIRYGADWVACVLGKVPQKYCQIYQRIQS